MQLDENEEKLLRSVALQNAKAILLARERAEREMAQAKEALQQSNEQITNILESITDGFIAFDTDWNIVFLNRRTEELISPLKKKKADVIGQPLWDVFPNLSGTTLEENYRRAMREQVTVQFEFYYPPLNVWLDIRAYPSPKGLTVYSQDITQRKRAEENLRLQHEWFAVTLASIGDAVITTNTDELVTFLNPVAEAMTGWKKDDAAGKPLASVFHIINERTRAKAESPISKVLRDGKVVALANHTALVAKDGREIAIEDSAAPIRNPEGKITGAVMVFHDVTERRRAERALKESEKRFAALVSASAQIVWVADANAGFAEYSSSWNAFTGQSFEEMKGWGRLNVIHPQDLPSLKAAWETAIANKSVLSTDYRLRHVSNEWRWTAVRAVPLLANDGSIRSWVGMNTDITEQRRAEQSLSESESRKSAILNAALDAIVTMNHEGKVVDFNPAAEQIFGYTWDQAVDKPLANLIIPERYRERHNAGLKKYLETGKGPVLSRRLEFPALRADGTEFETELSITRIADIEPPLFTATLRDISERKRIEETLRQSEERLRATFNQAAVGIATADLSGHFLDANQKFQDILGYSLEELRGMTFADVTHPDDVPLTYERTRQLRTGELSEIVYEKRYVHKDGSLVWSLTTVTFLKDAAGQPQRYIGVIEDISQRKNAEVERARLTNVLERSLNEIYIFDTQSLRFEYVNEGARRNLGYSMEEMRRKTPIDIKPEFTTERFWEVAEPLLAGEKEKQVFYTVHRRANGTDYPVEVHLQAVVHERQKSFLAVILDITERKKAEEAVRLSEERFRNAVAHAAIGVAIKSVDGDYLDSNPAYSAITGYSKDELAHMKFHSILHPEDRAEDQRLVEEMIAGKSPGFVITNRYLRKDKRTVWVQKSVSVVRDSQGKPLHVIAFVEDATQRKEAEDTLRRSEEELRALADSIPQLAWMAEPDGAFFWYNRRWYEYTGTTPEQMTGWGWKSVHDPEMLPSVLERWTHSIQTGEPFEMEFPLKGADGRFRWFLTRISPVRDVEGRVVRWFGTNTDVDEVKRAREALQEETRILELLNNTGTAIASKLDLERLVQTVTDSATQLTGATFGAFFYNVINAQGEALLLYTLSGAPREAFEKFGMPRNTAVFNPTFTGKEVVRSPDITQDPRYGKMGPHHGMPKGHLPVRSYLAVPVISRSGEVIGGLFFGHPDANVFTERSERLVLGVAAQAAIAIDNARLYESAQREIAERTRAEQALEERVRLTAARAEISAALATSDTLESVLHRCTDALVHHVGAAFARVWVIAPDSDELVLRASAGLYTHLDGPHSRIRIGQFKIGRIAASRTPLITNEVQEDHNISDPVWARNEGMTSFAGYPLVVENNLLGVVGMFARQPIPEAVLKELALIADGVAQWIQRKQAEQALRAAQETLSRHAEDLEQQVEERTASLRDTIGELEAFSYSISHDMRAPLRAMQSFAFILGEEYGPRLGPEGQEYIQRITRSAERMDRLIQDVLNYSRVARTDLPLEPVNLKTLLQDILQTYPAFQPPAAEIEVENDLPVVMGNQAILTQCFSNLLGNAVKFVPSGVLPAIQIRTENADDPHMIRICIRDNGVGIDPDQHDRIFGIFHRASKNYEGTGIGLAIVKKGAERIGGKVGLISRPGEGSMFWLELKRASP